MTCIGTFGSIVARKEDEYVIWELIYELSIGNELIKEISSFMSLLASIVLNDSYGVQDLPLLGLVMQYKKLGSVLNKK